MSLGNNRDYKTTARRVINNIQRHKLVMDILTTEGIDAATASRIAFDIIMTHKRRTAILKHSKLVKDSCRTVAKCRGDMTKCRPWN